MRKLIHFPNKNEIYFDSSGSSLKFKKIISFISSCYRNYPFNLNSNLSNDSFKKMENIVTETKKKLTKILNCNKSENIFFSPSSSYSFNFLAISFSQKKNIKGKKILLTKLEHSSNIYPWINISNRKNIEIEYVNLEDNFLINEEDLKFKIDKKTKIFSFSHVSNNIGVKNDVEKIAKIVREKSKDCIIILDASQSISSEFFNLREWKIDVLIFSCHKFYGPNGIGVMWMSERAKKFFPEIFWGGGKNFESFNNEKKFEVGSVNLAGIFGLYKALQIFENLNLEKLRFKRKKLRIYAIKELKKNNNIKIYNEFSSESIILFNEKRFHSHDVSNFLTKKGIYVRSGNFCTPFIEELIKVNSAVRLSISLYNNKKEIDLFIKYLMEINKYDIL